MCQTGLICYGSPAYDPKSTLKGVCTLEVSCHKFLRVCSCFSPKFTYANTYFPFIWFVLQGDIGNVCLFNEDCSSSVCALFSIQSTRKVCCDSSIDYNGEKYCSQLPDAHKCAFDDMCLDPRVCYGSTSTSSGICQSQISSGVCIRDAECVGSCGSNVTNNVCCPTVYTYAGKHYCDGLAEGAPCYFDATCGSPLICLGAKNDGSTVGIERPLD